MPFTELCIYQVKPQKVTNQLFERELPQDFSITPEYKEERHPGSIVPLPAQ